MDVNNLLSFPVKNNEGEATEPFHDDEKVEDEIDILLEIYSELNADDCRNEVSAGLAKNFNCRFQSHL